MRLVYALVGLVVTLVMLLSLIPLALLAFAGEGSQWLALRLVDWSETLWSRATS